MSEFTDAIAHRMDGREAISTGICSGCGLCLNTYGYDTQEALDEDYGLGNLTDEPHFSKSPCDCCGSSMSGDRHDAHFTIPDSKGSVIGQPLHHMEICTDCLLYLANGDVPENWEG